MKKTYIISSRKRNIDNVVKNTILVSVVFSGLTILYLTSNKYNAPTLISILSLCVIAVTIALVASSIVRKQGGINLSINHPLSLYGFFYFLYYLLAYLILFFSGNKLGDNELGIASLLFVGYMSWYAGIKISNLQEIKFPEIRFGKKEAQVLLFLCIIAIGLVIYAYTWRTSHGIFFSHTRHYEQELSVAASIRDVFISQLQLPIILFLGLLSVVQYKQIASISHRLFILYGIGIVLILTLSSQIRMAITALIFILISKKTHSISPVKLRHILIIGLIGFAIVIFIQSVRVESQNIVSAENQFIYAIKKSANDALSGLDVIDSYSIEIFINRIGGSLIFLSNLIDIIDNSNSFLYGEDIITSLLSLVPRFLWANKPAVIPPDLIVQDLLGIQRYDATLGPIIQFYVEGGVLGVIIGYFLFGWLMGIFTKKTIASNKIGLWIFLIFLWSHISNLELELILGILGTIRNAFVVYLLYRALFLLLGEVRLFNRSLNAKKQGS